MAGSIRLRALLACVCLCAALSQVGAFSTLPRVMLRASGLRSASHVRPVAFAPNLRKGTKNGGLQLKMQWMDTDELSQPQWSAFKAYNMGRWKGRALHLSPETGDYVPPFSCDYVLDILEVEEGAQSAIQRLTAGNMTAPRMSELTIAANDDFSCSDDGSYSLDRSLVSLSDVSGTLGETARFCIEISVSVSEEERVRCAILYDFESKLSRIVIFEEQRIVSTGAQRLIGIKLDETKIKSSRAPLTMVSSLGEFRGEAVGRRAWRLGGGNLQFKSWYSMEWDAKGAVRRENEIVDQRLRQARKAFWGEVPSPAVEAVDLDGGYRLLFLPSGCWVCVPRVLETVKPPSAPAASAPAAAPAGDDAATASAKAALEAALASGDGDGPDGREALAGLRGFSVEFGCFLAEGTMRRVTRLYSNDGQLVSATSATESRVRAKGSMYDE